jgi:hypothetical protein
MTLTLGNVCAVLARSNKYSIHYLGQYPIAEMQCWDHHPARPWHPDPTPAQVISQLTPCRVPTPWHAAFAPHGLIVSDIYAFYADARVVHYGIYADTASRMGRKDVL